MKKFIYFLMPLFGMLAVKTQAQTAMQQTAKGALYQVYTTNPGEKIKLNDVITFQVIQKTDKDSLLYSTYKEGHPVQVQIVPSQNVGDLMEVFPLLTVKDSALVKVPTDTIFKGHEEARPPFFPKGSYLTFILKIEKIQTLDEAIADKNAEVEKLKQAEAITTNDYITKHNLKVITRPSGLKYIITSPSAKPKPLAGDSVFVNYTGRTIDGKVFDSSNEAVARAAGIYQPGRPYQPISFIVGKGAVIPGWDEGLLLLNAGSKASFIIPSGLAYGEKGAGDISPFSTLLFDVELVRVKPGKHAAALIKKGTAKKPLAKKPAVKKS